jgi:hypothetical protein
VSLKGEEHFFCLGFHEWRFLFFFFSNEHQKRDLVRPFDRNLSHSSLPVIRERERERERVKSQRSARESLETKKSR